MDPIYVIVENIPYPVEGNDGENIEECICRFVGYFVDQELVAARVEELNQDFIKEQMRLRAVENEDELDADDLRKMRGRFCYIEISPAPTRYTVETIDLEGAVIDTNTFDLWKKAWDYATFITARGYHWEIKDATGKPVEL